MLKFEKFCFDAIDQIFCFLMQDQDLVCLTLEDFHSMNLGLYPEA